MKISRFNEPQIIGILKQSDSGAPVAELCRQHGMSSAAFYKWRSKYGGMDVSMMSEKKALEDENRRLKRMFADLSMQNELLKEALGEKIDRPSERREMAGNAIMRRGVSIALACRAFGVSEICYRYCPILKTENERIDDLLIGLTRVHKTWGFGLCFLHLRNVKGHS